LLTVRPGIVAAAAALALIGVFTALLLPARHALRDEMQRTLIERAGAMLHPIVLQRFAARTAAAPDADNLGAVLRSAEQPGMLAMAVFNEQGGLVQAVPASLPFIDLSPADYLELTRLQPLSRYHPEFMLHTTFGSDDTPMASSPVLEVLLPLNRPGETHLAGAVQYWIDARALATDIEAIDARISRQTQTTLALGAALIGLVVGLSYWRLSRAQREIAERNERLIRANLELSLAAKASVLGQITSHLLHGLQAPVAGLRAVMATRGRDHANGEDDWQTAADYTARLQQMIQQTVAMLGERQAHVSYELDGAEFAGLLRERHRAAAHARGVTLLLESADASGSLPSHRGNLLALVAGNLIENAIEASPRGATVRVTLTTNADLWHLQIADTGRGIPPRVREELFRPGRSTKAGGTGLGLAISHLLARQIGAELALRATGERGTTFEIALPLETPSL
jgi:signal transduction histidine kinase